MADEKLIDRIFNELPEKISRADLELAEAEVLKRIRENPSSPEYYRHLVEIMFRLSRTEEAVRLITEALEQYQDATGAFQACLGAAYFWLGEFEKSRNAYEQACRKSPKNLGWLYRLSLSENKLGNISASQRHCQTIFQLEEEGAAPFQNRHLLQRLAIDNCDETFFTKLGIGPDFIRLVRFHIDPYAEYEASVKKSLISFYKQRSSQIPDFTPDWEYLECLFRESLDAHQWCMQNGAYCHMNFSGRLVNIENYCRRTVGSPAVYESTVYLGGASEVYGQYCADDHTLASFLQKRYLDAGLDGVRVVNKGVSGHLLDNFFMLINGVDLKPGDRVVAIILEDELSLLGWESLLNLCLALTRLCSEKGASFLAAFYPRVVEATHPTEYEKNMAVLKRLWNPWSMPQSLPPVDTRHPFSFPFIIDHLRAKGIKCLDLQRLASGPHGWGEIYADFSHMAPNGNLAAADLIFHALQTECHSADSIMTAKKTAIKRQAQIARYQYLGSTDLQGWLASCRQVRPAGPDVPVGAIVMNCNPFTKGHLYLIKKSLEKINSLYIFVVEEERSAFSFKDRLKMVKEGVAGLGNRIAVVPSGSFVISDFSFPGYFSKATVMDPDQYDSSFDVLLFGAIIAPALKITTRFVGEEPFCQVTSAYNRCLKEVLPPLGVEVISFPRKELNGDPISASRVRQLVENGCLAEAKELLPSSSWDYLSSMTQRPQISE